MKTEPTVTGSPGTACYAYLVVLSHTMDDVPIRMLPTRDAAFDFANDLAWDVPETLGRLLELPDCSTPNVISILTFRDGVPVSRVIVREFDEESDDDEDGVVPVEPTPVQ